jgi:hypothetical protein
MRAVLTTPASCPRWVKLRSLSAQLGSPLYPQEQTSPAGPVRSEKCHRRTKDRPRSYFGLRGNGINPSRFGILTLGSDCASITSFDPTIPLRLRI